MDGQLPESPLIVEYPGQAFGSVEIAEDPLEFSERMECGFQIEAKIDSPLQRLACLRQMADGGQHLLEAHHGLPVGRSRACKLTRLAPIADRLARKPGLGEMLGDDLGQPFGQRREPFDQALAMLKCNCRRRLLSNVA